MNLIAVILTPIFVYVLFLAIHWIPFRFSQVVARTRTMTLILLVCLPLSIPVYRELRAYFPIPASMEVYLLRFLVFMGFTLLWCGYVQYVFSFDGSPSLRFLVEILSSPKRELSADEIHQRFSFEDVYRRRIDRAVKGKALLGETAGSEIAYKNSRGATRWAHIASFLKDFMNLGEGG